MLDRAAILQWLGEYQRARDEYLKMASANQGAVDALERVLAAMDAQDKPAEDGGNDESKSS